MPSAMKLKGLLCLVALGLCAEPSNEQTFARSLDHLVASVSSV